MANRREGLEETLVSIIGFDDNGSRLKHRYPSETFIFTVLIVCPFVIIFSSLKPFKDETVQGYSK